MNFTVHSLLKTETDKETEKETDRERDRWTHMGHKEWSEYGKTFTRCYTIALNFWDEFNVN